MRDEAAAVSDRSRIVEGGGGGLEELASTCCCRRLAAVSTRCGRCQPRRLNAEYNTRKSDRPLRYWEPDEDKDEADDIRHGRGLRGRGAAAAARSWGNWGNSFALNAESLMGMEVEEEDGGSYSESKSIFISSPELMYSLWVWTPSSTS